MLCGKTTAHKQIWSVLCHLKTVLRQNVGVLGPIPLRRKNFWIFHKNNAFWCNNFRNLKRAMATVPCPPSLATPLGFGHKGSMLVWRPSRLLAFSLNLSILLCDKFRFATSCSIPVAKGLITLNLNFSLNSNPAKTSSLHPKQKCVGCLVGCRQVIRGKKCR